MRLNWFNYLYLPVDGYGRLGIKTVQALLRLGHEVRPYTVDALDNPAWFQQAQGIVFDKVSVQLMPPHHMKHVPGRSIAYTMHESGTLPIGWAEHVNAKNQFLFVPSQYMAEVMQENHVKIPISVVKGAIDPEECQMVMPNRNRPYTFGCLADRGMRKGWDLVYSAFYKAFDHKNRDVALKIKCRPGSLPMLDYSYGRDDRLSVWKADVDNIADIYAQFDAYVFPTRCEGLGMPPLEAAACGLPVLVTRWSGTADDTDKWAIPLEKYTIIDSHMGEVGGDWAEPDLDELIWRMQWLYEHQDEAKEKGVKAAKWLRANRTYEHAAKHIVSQMADWMGGPLELREPQETTFEIPTGGVVHSNGHKVMA